MKKPRVIKRIVSGGQTGTDRAALDFALENGIEVGGFIPKGRLAEDGRISNKYPNLIETETDDLATRTELNVLTSDATLIFSHGPLSGGSQLTRDLARRYKKPVLHIDFLTRSIDEEVRIAHEWMNYIDCRVLNIAGPRASEDAEIYDRAKEFLNRSIGLFESRSR